MSREHLVTRIVRDSILDGPGCRYVVFLKGCNLRCPWCHNPETQDARQEVITYRQFCIGCGRCARVLGLDGDGGGEGLPVPITDTADPRYQRCADVCPSRAIERVARAYTVEALLADASKYATIYRETGGGITLSGGDPLAAADFAAAFLAAAGARGFHTAVDTAGSGPWDAIARLAPHVDLWLYDLKHPEAASVAAPRVAENLHRLAEQGARCWIRVPLIPDFNDDESAWEGLVAILAPARTAVEAISLLPYHPYGQEKYEALGRTCPIAVDAAVPDATLEAARATFARAFPGVPVSLGRTMAHG